MSVNPRVMRGGMKRSHSILRQTSWGQATRCLLSLLIGVVGFLTTNAMAVEAPEYAHAEAKGTGQVDWLKVIEQRVPPLRHERGGRWPMILWECGPLKPLPEATIKMLLARGLTPHIQMTTNHLVNALALKAAGAPVIMMQGAGGPWPAQLAGNDSNWAHRLDAGYTPASYVKPCLSSTEGWAIEADVVRATLRAYRDAGVTVDGVWMDWEGDPMSGSEAFAQASRCSRCRAMLPAAVMSSTNAFHVYRWRLYMDLLSTYLAAPVREVFPKCELTNWMMVWSTPERPVRFWDDRVLPPTAPAFFTAANPVAYGNTVYWKSWDKAWPVDREGVDRFYFHLLIRMVSDNEANLAQWAPQVNALPWVSRYCPDEEDPAIPIMSRERYREVLRHLWLRGVDGMQVFNAVRKGFEDLSIEEVEDAVAVYDELLTHREFLEGGRVLCLDVPGPRQEGVVWSGLVLGDRALVRAFTQGGGTATLKIEPWPGAAVELRVPAKGRTWLLEREGNKVKTREG